MHRDGKNDEDEWWYQIVEWSQNNPENVVIQFGCESSDKKSKLYIDNISLIQENKERFFLIHD